MFLFRDKKNKLIPRKGLKDAQSSFKLRSFVSSPWCSSFFHTPLLSSFYVEIFFRKIKASFFFLWKKKLATSVNATPQPPQVGRVPRGACPSKQLSHAPVPKWCKNDPPTWISRLVRSAPSDNATPQPPLGMWPSTARSVSFKTALPRPRT